MRRAEVKSYFKFIKNFLRKLKNVQSNKFPESINQNFNFARTFTTVNFKQKPDIN